jgi:hypothetical protein
MSGTWFSLDLNFSKILEPRLVYLHFSQCNWQSERSGGFRAVKSIMPKKEIRRNRSDFIWSEKYRKLKIENPIQTLQK